MATIRSLLWVRFRRVAAPLPPPAALPLWALPSRLRRLPISTADRDLATLCEADKTRGYYLFARFETVSDYRLRLILFLHRDRPHTDGIVILDDVHKGAVWPSLHRAGRNHHHLFQRVDQQSDVDELTGPELQVGIGKFGLELDGAGRLVNLVVDHPEHAAVDHSIIV